MLLGSPLAGAYEPLPAPDLNPLVQIHGLPAFEGARLLAPGRGQARVSLAAASHFLRQENAAETLVLDGETHRLDLTLKYRWGAAEWGIQIPYLTHSAGFLDGFIEDWHDTFCLPQSGRDQAPRDQLDFRYRRDGATRVQLSHSSRGIGDVRLLGGWPLADDPAFAAALRASLKLPTGEAAGLRGSGAADLALWVTAGCGACASGWGWNATGGVLVLGRGDVLPELQRTYAAFGGGGVGWRASDGIVLKAELHAHSPLYRHTRVRALDRTALQLVLGGGWALTARTVLEVAVTEDVRVETVPDVGFLLSLATRF